MLDEDMFHEEMMFCVEDDLQAKVIHKYDVAPGYKKCSSMANSQSTNNAGFSATRRPI
jgi:hypothetical protein